MENIIFHIRIGLFLLLLDLSIKKAKHRLKSENILVN
jgi:hypothetical protein